MRWILPLLVCAFAPHSLLAEAASGWHVKIARHGTNQSLVSWNFVGAITSVSGVQWNAGVHSMGGFGISSPQTDLTGFYSGPSLSSPRFSDKGGFAHVGSGYEEPFIYVEITPTGVWLKMFTMQIKNSPFTRTPLPSGSVVMDIPFSAFGKGVYSPSTNTFWHNAIQGGFDTTLTVLSYNTDPPVIALIGSPTVTVFRGTTFADEGANVTDDLDPSRTITGSGAVDTSTVGTYVLTYTAQDSYGNEAAPVTRTVNVVLNPTGDEDNDGLNNTEEANLGTSPYLRDTDGDGVNDLREVGDATDPLNPASFDPLNLGLVAYYPFNGDVRDQSGNSNHGSPQDLTPLANDSPAGGSAYRFNGASSHVSVPHNESLALQDFTFSVWIKPARVMGEHQSILLKHTADMNGVGSWIFMLQSGTLVFQATPLFGGSEDMNAAGAVSPNEWRHYVLSYSSQSKVWTYYLNGAPDGSGVNLTPRQLNGSTAPLLIGAEWMWGGGKRYFYQGDMDAVRIYNRSLSSAEVALLHANDLYSGFGLEGAATKAPFDPATVVNWSAGGTEWSVDTATTHDGVDSVKAQTTDGQSTYREYTVTGPAVVDFWWKVSSEQDYDKFSYSLNGIQQQAISGEVDWTYRTLTLPAGTHTLRWTYAKDGSDAVGQDAGWLDDFAVYPAEATLQVRDGETELDGDVTVDFGDADIGSAGFTKSLTFSNEGFVPLEVELSLPEDSPFTFDGGVSTYPILIGRGDSVDVPIYLETQSAGTKTAALTIAAPDSTVATPQITLSGDVLGPVVGVLLGATPLTSGQTVDMGLAPKTLEFTIRNDGNAGNLDITQISAVGNFQIVQQAAASVAPQGSTTFKVLAQSGSFGPQTGSITVVSSDGFTPTFTIGLASKVFLEIADGITDGGVATSGASGGIGWDFAPTGMPDGSMGLALKSGATPNNGSSIVEMVAQQAGVISWSWKVSSQQNFDWLLCEVDGREVAGVSAKNGTWQTQAAHVAEGSTVRWLYRKDGSASAGEDAGYITSPSIMKFEGPQSGYDFQRPPFSKLSNGLPAIAGWLGALDFESVPLPAVYGIATTDSQPRFRFPASKSAKGLFLVEFSRDLVNWSARGIQQRVVSSDSQRVIFEATAPDSPMGFFRLYPVAIPDTADPNYNNWRQSARSSLDSVYEINRRLPIAQPSQMDLRILKANVDHLKIVSDRNEYIYYPYFQTREEFSSISRAIVEGDAYLRQHGSPAHNAED